MTPDEVVKVLEELKNAGCGNNYDGSPCRVRSKEEIEALSSAITFIQDYQKLRGKVDKLELVKVADKSLGYNGLGTKMTPKEIDKMFSAIVTYLQQPTEH